MKTLLLWLQHPKACLTIAFTILFLSSYAQPEAEPNDLPAQANVITAPASVTAAIGTNMDVDYYKVTCNNPCVVIAGIPANTSGITFIVEVMDLSLNLINSAKGFSLGDAVQTESNVAAGDYLIKVSRYSISFSPNNGYQLNISVDASDTTEVNASLATAKAIPLNTSVFAKKRGFNRLLNNVGDHSDRDFYKVGVSKCGVINPVIPANNTNMRLSVNVTDSATSQLVVSKTAVSAGAGLDFEFMASPRTYIIEVTNFLGNAVSAEPYFLTVNYDTTDEGGCNHDFNSAYAMPMCDTAIATIRPADSVDYYKVTGLGNMFTAKVTNVPSNLALRITAINSNQIAITSATGAAGQDVSLSIPTVNNDVYYFKVEDMNGQKNNNAYRFAVSDTSCTPVVGLSDIRIDKLCIYPNPNNGKFRVMLDEAATITISNTIGQLVKKLFTQKGITEFELNEQPGIYYLTVSTSNAPTTQKIIIQ